MLFFFASLGHLETISNIKLYSPEFYLTQSIQMCLSLLSDATMAGSIKLFETVRKCYHMMGIYSIQSNQIQSFNLKTFIFSLSNTCFFLSSAGYVLFRANTLQEYGISIFIVTTIFILSVNSLIIVWRLKHILKFIDMCDSFIEKSKFIPKTLIFNEF